VKLMGCLILGSMLSVTTAAIVTAQEPAQHELTLRSRVFANTRTIRVLLPPGYDTPANGTRRYPVFYFTDGIAAWHAWGVPAVVKELWRKQAIPPFIFVGIDNGGSTRESKAPDRDRASEYLPYPDQTWAEAPPEADGGRFPKFLFEEVVPLINRTFRTIPDGRCTGLAGSSYGAAVALHTAMRHPDLLGFVLLESPSLHIGNGQLLRDAAAAEQWPRRVYIGVGTAEGDSQETRDRMVADVRALRVTLDRARRRPTVLLAEREGATHWYDAWRARLPPFFTWPVMWSARVVPTPLCRHSNPVS